METVRHFELFFLPPFPKHDICGPSTWKPEAITPAGFTEGSKGKKGTHCQLLTSVGFKMCDFVTIYKRKIQIN